MKKIVVIACMLVTPVILSSAQSDISTWFTEKSSNSIVISNETVFSIYNTEKLTIARTYEAVIKNDRAKDLKSVRIYYDKYQSIDEAEVSISDISGQEIEKYKLKDFDDMATGLSNTASDGRMKYLKINYNKYPFCIKVSHKVTKKGSLHYPVWTPQAVEKQRLVSGRLTVLDYTGNSFRYECVNVPEPERSSLEQGVKYTWAVENREPFIYEDMNYDLEYYAPIVYTAPNAFEMDDYVGDMQNWNSFGRWISTLNQGKNDLQPGDLYELDRLMDQTGSTYEKVRTVYSYLQQNTRYVSIQLGIGGWQPFSASYVHNHKYGDCKALSFYTKSLLEHYGIRGYYTLISAGAYAAEMKHRFPNAHFNHAILTVPVKDDTLFLECTSQTSPFGYLGTFTSDRSALMITDDGGKVIRTKKYTADQSIQYTNVVIDLEDNGDGEVLLNRQYTGIEIDNYSFLSLYQRPADKPEEWLVDNHDWGNVSVHSFSLHDLKNEPIPSGGFSARFSSKKEASAVGKRLFFNPGKYSDIYISKLPDKERRTPMLIKYGYSQIDSVTINHPSNYIFEKSLREVNVTSKYGTYKRALVKDEGQFLYIRTFIIHSGFYPREEYGEFREFINKVLKLDNERVVLVNRT